MTQTQMRKQEAAIAAIFVKVRYFVKATKSVIYDIESGINTYRVCLNANGTAACTCDGNAKWHKICKHIKAMWRLEEEREMSRRAAPLVAEAVEIVEATAAMSTAYEVLAPTKDVSRCRHCNKPSRSGLCYQCAN